MSATEHVGVMAPRLADWRAPRSKLWQLFRDELTLSRPRTFRMFRMTALVMLVIVISMALRVPNAALSTYMIFFVSKADVATTARIGIGGLLGVTIAILLSFVLYSVAFSEPAVRRLFGDVLSTHVAGGCAGHADRVHHHLRSRADRWSAIARGPHPRTPLDLGDHCISDCCTCAL